MDINQALLKKQVLKNLARLLADGCDMKQARGKVLEEFRIDGVVDPEHIELINSAVSELDSQLGSILSADVPVLTQSDRRAWYTGPREDDVHWPALKDYLLTEKKWSEDSVDSIDVSSTAVISQFAPPELPSYAVRGLVIGHVQSGKTANMTGVIAKAVDRGFRLIVVLAGLTDALRSQTQRRLEADLVERAPGKWLPLTDSEPGGDFHGGTIRSIPTGGAKSEIKLLVLKKQTNRLERFIQKLNDTTLPNRQQLKTLIIDDESDQASVNVGEEYDPSSINKLIRQILKLLPAHVYLGYTATPFANVFIDPHAAGIDDDVDDDLYPRDFIESLPTPPDYFGAEKLFGRDLLDADSVPPDQAGVDVIRKIPDKEIPLLRPKRAEIDLYSPQPTDSLMDAIRWYVIATAVRNEPAEHSSMLIHVTELVEGHKRLKELVQLVVNRLSEKIKNRDKGALAAFEELWNRELPRLDAKLPGRSWKVVQKRLIDVLESVEVIEEHGQSEQRLDYSDDNVVRRYIAIGGNVLARGLTIEGLVVSYFLRSGRQYDTLLQMGRWFGYRRGYEDLPRMWMPDDMAESFRDLATVEAEIRNDIKVYARDKLTPMEFAIRIRQVPGMMITRKSAMRRAEECDLSYSGEHVQTFRFYRTNKEWLANNWKAGSDLANRIMDYSVLEKRPQGYLVRNVDVQDVRRFLNSYEMHETHEHIRTAHLLKYIEKYESNELKKWNVGVICTKDGKKSEKELGEFGKVNTVRRARLNIGPEEAADIKALMSRQDLMIDVEERGKASDGWERLKDIRSAEFKGKSPPLLLLYPINAKSEPATEVRLPLDAAADVLGLGIVFPGMPKEAKKYVRVTLDPVAAEDE